MRRCMRIHESDNVAVALTDIKKGETVEVAGVSITASEDIRTGHKIALTELNAGDAVVKYGYPIGVVSKQIKQGEWVHVHNLKTGLGDLLSYTYEPQSIEASKTDVNTSDSKVDCNTSDDKEANKNADSDCNFLGYQRPDGSVGVRNEIWIIPTVGCVNQVALDMAKRANEVRKGSVDEVIAFTHPYGCSQLGEDQEFTRIILSDLVHHPNAAGVLVLGLGCENSNIDILKTYIGQVDEQRVKFLVCQDVEDEMAEGLSLLNQLIDYAAGIKREPISVSKLIIGLKCGGSDGLSGITANPVVGRFSDLLVQQGGTAILTEVPEMFGAETLLMNRCQNELLFDKTVEMVNNFKDYFIKNNQTIYENPSPGNKEGGISTLEDKSLGCIQKSGSSTVRGVLMYGDRLVNRGLNLLYAPGNDLVASTALAASGAQIILFTTGRGTPFASVVPTIKISSNSELAHKKNNWIDFDAGVCIKDTDIDSCAEDLFKYVLEVASGKQVSSEKAGFHDMAIFKQGVTL